MLILRLFLPSNLFISKILIPFLPLLLSMTSFVASGASITLCEPTSDEELRDLLGSAYNARFMALERPSSSSGIFGRQDVLAPRLSDAKRDAPMLDFRLENSG